MMAVLLLLCNFGALIAAAAAASPEYLQTLPTATQKAVAHCNKITNDDEARLLCYLIDGLNSQAHDANVQNATSPPFSCLFRREGGHRLHRYAKPSSPHFDSAVAAYVAMHRRCTAAESHEHVAAIHNNKNSNSSSSNVVQCRYVVAGGISGGLGNRMLAMASTFIYALVSQRVMLLSYREWRRIFCEPFAGAIVDDAVPFYGGVGVSALQFLAKPAAPVPVVVSLGLHHTSPDAELRLLTCPETFARLRDVAILHMRGSNQFFATGMFENPALAPILRLLFPERNPFHVVSKFLYAPSDEMWRRISAEAAVLRAADRRVGVQIREFRGYTAAYDDNILRCIVNRSSFCPRPEPRGHVSVYVATLVRSHLEKLRQRRGKMEAGLGRQVSVVTQRLAEDDGVERHDGAHQQEAFLDMWMLSLSDVLLTSFDSTFGYVSQALGGLVPFYIHRSSSEEEVCRSGFSSEPCYHFPPKEWWSCSYTSANATTARPPPLIHVKPCPDRPSGWQLTPP